MTNALTPLKCENCNISCKHIEVRRIDLINGFDVEFQICCSKKKFIIKREIFDLYNAITFQKKITAPILQGGLECTKQN